MAKALSVMKAKGKTEPKRSDGTQKCITFHCKGYCYDQCRLAYDHKPNATADADSFFEWCREAYA